MRPEAQWLALALGAGGEGASALVGKGYSGCRCGTRGAWVKQRRDLFCDDLCFLYKGGEFGVGGVEEPKIETKQNKTNTR